MPTGRGVRFTVLVEDRALERFVRECLHALGVHTTGNPGCPIPRRAGLREAVDRPRVSRPGPERIAERSFENIALIVGTDADEQTVQQRVLRLNEMLQEVGHEPRASHERLALWIPRWNIETWLLFLSGRDVHEAANYKGQAREVDPKAAAREFIRRFRRYLQDPGAETHLPSLVSAFDETKRIQQALDRRHRDHPDHRLRLPGPSGWVPGSSGTAGRVFGTVRSPGRAAEIAGLGIEPVIADVLQPESLDAAAPRPIASFTASASTAPPGRRCAPSTSTGCRTSSITCRLRWRRLVYASSTGVYGQTDGEWVDEDSPTCPQHESGQVCPGGRGTRPRLGRDAGLGGRSCGSRVCTGRAGSCAGRSSNAASRSPAIPDKFLNLIHIDDAARAAAAALDADESRTRSIWSATTGRSRAASITRWRRTCIGGSGAPIRDRPAPGSPEAARDATNKRVANHRMKRGLGHRADLSRHHDRPGRGAEFDRSGKSIALINPSAPARRSSGAAPWTIFMRGSGP